MLESADLLFLFAQPTEQQLLTISFRLSTSFLRSLGSPTTRVLRSARSQATPHKFLPSLLTLKMAAKFMTLRLLRHRITSIEQLQLTSQTLRNHFLMARNFGSKRLTIVVAYRKEACLH